MGFAAVGAGVPEADDSFRVEVARVRLSGLNATSYGPVGISRVRVVFRLRVPDRDGLVEVACALRCEQAPIGAVDRSRSHRGGLAGERGCWAAGGEYR